MLKLWLIERTQEYDYDQHSAAVIRAETEQQVRQIAAETLLPRGCNWTAQSWAKVTLLDTECLPGDLGIVLDSFHAG